ncbi:hypothetical protein O9993_09050 [Vibrio lentus]|nr:hypothetical protein [Vibrio lentus]
MILTADRGRGKSSIIRHRGSGARSRNARGLNIIVTAPSVKAVEPVFAHASHRLDPCEVTSTTHIVIKVAA